MNGNEIGKERELLWATNFSVCNLKSFCFFLFFLSKESDHDFFALSSLTVLQEILKSIWNEDPWTEWEDVNTFNLRDLKIVEREKKKMVCHQIDEETNGVSFGINTVMQETNYVNKLI